MVVSFLPDFLKEVVTPDPIEGLLFAWGCPVESGLPFAWRCPIDSGMTTRPVLMFAKPRYDGVPLCSANLGFAGFPVKTITSA